MKIKRITSVALSVILSVLTILSIFPISTFAADSGYEAISEGHTLVMQSDRLTVARRKTIQMTATVTNVEVQPEIVWSSSDESIATVDSNGKVKGVDVGRAVIFAQAEVDGEIIRGEFAINVVKRNSPLKNLLESHQMMSYQYSYIDDYYYTNDKDAWQHDYGFGKIYDYVSPYLLLEYDYIRIFFTYEDKDWMLQMWKGQYGLVFYGGEIGIYNRPHSDEEIDAWTMFNCPEEEDWLKMEMTLWHEDIRGNWNREFTRPYDYYWWCTGFKNGHLRQQEPADELRLTGRITFKDEGMAALVADGFAECGLEMSSSKDGMSEDSFYKEGSDIHFSWQNVSEAESTMFIKVATGVLGSILLLPFAPIIAPFVAAYVALVFIVSTIL